VVEPLPRVGWLLLIAAAMILPFSAPASARPGLDVVVLFLGALSLVPMLGWLRAVSFASPAAAAAGAWVASTLLGRNQALPVVVLAAAAAGAALVAVAVAPVRGRLQSGLPWTSLAVAGAVAALLRLQAAPPLFLRPTFVGVSLAGDRATYVFGVVLAAFAAAVVMRVASAPAGRLLAVAGVAPVYTQACGARVERLVWTAAALSGAIAGLAGMVQALAGVGSPVGVEVSPATAVIWLGAAVLGGVSWVTGIMLGTAVVGVAAKVTAAPIIVIGGAALVVGVLLRVGAVAPGLALSVRRKPT
jgi:ABC-type branched-subunit amino acid transport system permease subunit